MNEYVKTTESGDNGLGKVEMPEGDGTIQNPYLPRSKGQFGLARVAAIKRKTRIIAELCGEIRPTKEKSACPLNAEGHQVKVCAHVIFLEDGMNMQRASELIKKANPGIVNGNTELT